MDDKGKPIVDKNGKTRLQIGGPNGVNVQEQVVNATPTPNSDQLTPYWTEDEQNLYYASNNNASGRYQLFRVGAGAVNNPAQPGAVPEFAVTAEAGADHLYPVVNPASSRILFAKSTDGLAVSNTNKVWHLYASNLPLTGTISTTPPGATNLIPLTLGRSFRGKTFATVGRACWIGNNDVVFSARLTGDAHFHLFAINTTTLAIFQLTMGNADERNPAVSPDSRFIAFDSTATATVAGSSYTGGSAPRTETVDGDPAVSTGVNPSGHRNIFLSGNYGGFPLEPTPARQSPRQMTGRYTGAADVDNVEPSWSSSRANVYTNGNGNQYYIAFASARQPDNPSAPTTYTEAGTYDIYFVRASADRGQTLLEEGAPATAASAKHIDTADPNLAYNDEYPVWSPVVTLTRVVFQSDRTGSLSINNFGNGFSATPGTHDIFLASILDVTAPSLIRYNTNASTGEIVHVNLGNKYNANQTVRTRDDGLLPGQEAFFTVRVDDRESGLDSIWLQFKNPNSKYQSEEQGGFGREHKEYRAGAAIFLSNTDIPLWQELDTQVNAGAEYECEAVTLDGTQYVRHRLSVVPGGAGPLYIAGANDIAAFSGANFPPFDGNGGRPNCWLRLTPVTDDDGNPIAPADGRGGVLYGASWRLPAEASDWYVDVIAYDKAVSPLNPAAQKNWIIYDNVWGFSTALPLNPIDRDVLVVSDYTLGQKFFRSRSGQIVGSPSNLQGIGFGAESYYTDTEFARYPSEVGQRVESRNTDGTIKRQWAGVGPWIRGNPVPGTFGGIGSLNPGSVHPLGVGSYMDEIIESVSKIDTNGRTYRLPVTGRYTIWRTLARGPVPPELYQAYLPIQVETPADTRVGERTKRNTKIYNRLIVWASPFTGDLFVGPGSLTDFQTQTNLTNFVNQGGRVFVSGQDVGFALVGSGQANTFYTDTLGARYVADGTAGPTITGVGPLGNYPWFNLGLQIAWGGDLSQNPINFDPITARPVDINSSPGPQITALDAAYTGRYQDLIQPLAGSVAEFNNGGGNVAIISKQFPDGGATVYSAIGFETIGQQWYTYTPQGGTIPQIAMRGTRAKIMSNFSIGYRTGTIVGRLTDDAGSPVADALVRAIPINQAENVAATGTALTDAGGNFLIQGLPSSAYALYGYKAGYYSQHADNVLVHGANTSRISFNLKRANPGQLTNIPPASGVLTAGVLAIDKKTAIPGIEIQARRTEPDGRVAVLTAISRDASDARFPAGSYEIKDLLIGDYQIIVNSPDTYDVNGNLVPNPNYNKDYGTIRVTEDPQPNRFAKGAGTVVVKRPDGVDYLVIDENKVSQLDFYLPSAPQTVRGRVLNKNTGAGIAGALVTAVNDETKTTVASATTDADGNYTLQTIGTPSTDKLPAGSYTLTGAALGFSTETVNVAVTGAATVVAPDLRLTPLPPGLVSGTVTNLTGAGVKDATIRLFLKLGDVVSPTATYTTTTGNIAGQGTGYFKVDPVAPGTYIVTVEKQGLVGDPVQLPITVTTGVETRNVNFRLLPPAVFGDGVQLISTPYSYNGLAPRDIFGLTPTGDNDGDGTAGTAQDVAIFNVFTVADWTGVDYNIGPNIPILAGKGYFVKFGAITPVARTGNPLPGNTFTLTLTPGWNLIGHPFADPNNPTAPGQDLDLYTNASIVDSAGVSHTITEAVQMNLVGGVLFGYTGSKNGSQYYETRIMKPWIGYWFRNATDAPLRLTLQYPTSRAVKPMTGRLVRLADLKAVKTRSIESRGLNDWRIQIAAQQGSLLDTDNSIGVAPEAKDGYDNRFDTQKPPMLREVPGVYVAVEGMDAAGRAVGFADMIRAASGGTKSWNLTVDATQEGNVTLYWPNINRLPRGLEPFLVDVATGKRVAMRSGAGSYQFHHTGRALHRFRIEVGPAATTPLALTRVRVQAAGAGRGSGYRISFVATRAADVEAEIRTLGGRSIRQYQTRAVGAAENTWIWDGRDSSGAPLPAGSYVLTLTARDDQGRTARQQMPIATVR